MSPRVTGLRALLTTPGPSVGLEIAADRVTAVAVSWSKQRPVVAAYASEALPSGAVVPAVTAVNVVDRTAVTDAIRRVFERLPRRPSRVAVIVPDNVAKVSLVRFEKVPTRAADLDDLIRWQVRKAAPFRLEDAQVSSTPGAATPDGGREFVVALMRRDVVEEYEQVCGAAGGHAGVVDLASFNLINMALASAGSEQGDWLLVHVAPGYSTLAIVRGQDLIFFRNRPAEGDGNLANLVHQTAMYYEDRLGGGGFSRALLAGQATLDDGDGSNEILRRTLEDRLGARVEPLDTSIVTPGAGGADPAALAAPIGLLLRERLGHN